MAVKVNNIRISINDDLSIINKIAAKKTGISAGDMINFKILKESIDARRKGKIDFIYQVLFDCTNEEKVVKRAADKDVTLDKDYKYINVKFGQVKMHNRPIIIGSGPAGFFAGLVMAKNGYKPIIVERGSCVEKRDEKIKSFYNTGILDTDTNVQFGEGGAGTFSDGKLTTRIKDERCNFVLDEFVKFGAPGEIIYSGKPHIGTDILKGVVKNIRDEIIKLGGEVRFDSKVTDIQTDNGKITSVTINNEYEIPCEAVILAVGHSARDTYEMLIKRGMEFAGKPFAIGVRIEHKQSMINESQYGEFAGHPRLGAADYRVTYTSNKYGRPCYSFCMCPGGIVVAAASENGRVVTNGMSEYKRDGENANSAIVVGVTPDDFKGSDPLAGVEFQRHYEKLAYEVGGGLYMAPVQLVGDFLNDRITNKIGNIKPSYTRGYTFANIKDCLPDYVTAVLKEGIINFDRKIKGFSDNDAVLTGIETRTSAPVRMLRDENCEAEGLRGLYPAGEGAGYAGGIISSAVDGVRAAEKIMQKYAPIE